MRIIGFILNITLTIIVIWGVVVYLGHVRNGTINHYLTHSCQKAEVDNHQVYVCEAK